MKLCWCNELNLTFCCTVCFGGTICKVMQFSSEKTQIIGIDSCLYLNTPSRIKWTANSSTNLQVLLVYNPLHTIDNRSFGQLTDLIAWLRHPPHSQTMSGEHKVRWRRVKEAWKAATAPYMGRGHKSMSKRWAHVREGPQKAKREIFHPMETLIPLCCGWFGHMCWISVVCKQPRLSPFPAPYCTVFSSQKDPVYAMSCHLFKRNIVCLLTL